jgi:hypothetical protein
LKFGLYEDYGNLTCGGYPGVLQHMELDAKTFAGEYILEFNVLIFLFTLHATVLWKNGTESGNYILIV